MLPRRQLPVHSPLTLPAIAAACVRALGGESSSEELERLLARRFGADEVILFGSGTHALTAAIAAALEQAGRDRPVALPAYACYDVATAAVGADGGILLYDLDPDTLAPDWDSVERTLEDGAGVLVLAPLYGFPFDWDPAERLAERYGATVIEDAAQAAGAEWEGTPSGSMAGMSVLSFGRGKGWTGGRGGALLVRDPSPRPSLALSRPAPPRLPTPGLLAAVAAQWGLARPSLYAVPRAVPWLHLGETRYHAPSAPHGMPDLSAALALATDDLARAELQTRRSHGEDLARTVASIPGIAPIRVPPNATPGFLRMPCRIPHAEPRRRVVDSGAPFGVERGYPTTLAALTSVRERLARPTTEASIAGAHALARELVTLPTHSRVTRADRDRALALLRTADKTSPLSTGARPDVHS